jgi:hypothetical protein
LHSILNIAVIIELRRIKWAGNMTCMWEKCVWCFGGKKLKKREHIEDPGTDHISIDF